MKAPRYVPALGVDLLTPLYDPLVRVTVREMAFKRRLLDGACIAARHAVLDVGCGTGTLLALLARAVAPACAVGLDGDARILAIARRKLQNAARPAALVQGVSFALPFPGCSFDRVLSTLMLHHLTRSEKLETLREVHRVLRPGGEFHLADWGRPHNALMRVVSSPLRVGDHAGRIADNLDGRLPDFLRQVGFGTIREGRRFATVFGTIALYGARRPECPAGGL